MKRHEVFRVKTANIYFFTSFQQRSRISCLSLSSSVKDIDECIYVPRMQDCSSRRFFGSKERSVEAVRLWNHEAVPEAAWQCVFFRAVGGWNPVNSPVEVGSLSHYLQGFIHPSWCRISAINSSKNGYTWKMVELEDFCLSYWVSVTFQGAFTVKLREGRGPSTCGTTSIPWLYWN